MKLHESYSIKHIIKIFAVRLAAALLIPGLGTLLNELNSLITFLLCYGAGQIHGFDARKIISPTRHRINPAYRTQIIGVGILISHNAAGYGGYLLFI